MPRTPDRFSGPSVEEEQQWEDRGPGGDNAGDPTDEGALRRVTNVLRYFVNGAATQIARWKNTPADFDDVDLNGISDGQGLAYNATSKQFEAVTFPGAGGGEANTASNVGGEAEVFKQKVGIDLQFRTLEEDGGLNITQETDTVKLSTGFRRHFLMMGG